eukprot:TRINITY_DN16487_c0_g1_i1.p1 TRINITY_DN16487_c0_g1~~TRINITY_DN16487_c0_g1_i1.p1  ORF type:complete len:1393 (+),score=398.64 TRINITY_DN16487_c0_g1_i1:584-4180(+)
MAAPFTIRRTKWLREQRVWLCEKSDGLRSCLVVKRNAGFPRWAMLRDGSRQPLGLHDCLLLELTHAALTRAGKAESRGGMPFSFAVRGKREFKLCRTAGACGEELRLVDCETEEAVPLERSCSGWSFAYLFDRHCSVHLVLAEVAVPAPEGGWVDYAVADGELIHDLERRITVWLCFDLAALRVAGDPTPEYFARSPISVRVAAIRDRLVGPHSRWAGELRGTGAQHCPFDIRAKHFWPAAEAAELFRQIEHSGGQWVYRGPGGPNANDGAVIVPEEGALSSFSPGTCTTILKWKFAEKLTVDWQVLTDEHPHDAGSKGRQFSLGYIIKDRLPKTAPQGAVQYKEHVDYKMCRLALARPDLRTQLPKGAARIVEAGYEAELGRWVVHEVRGDKAEANSFMTVASVLEAIAEQQTPECLRRALRPPSPRSGAATAPRPREPSQGELAAACEGIARILAPHSQCTAQQLAAWVSSADPVPRAKLLSHCRRARERAREAGAEEEAAAATFTRTMLSAVPRRGYTHFMVRTMRDTEGDSPDSRRLVLQARARTTKFKHPRGFNYVDVRECCGLGFPSPADDPASPLLWLMYIQVANEGGCYHWTDCICTARFLPKAGRWEIISVEKGFQGKNHATITALLAHLEETCTLGAAPLQAVGTRAARTAAACAAPTDSHYADMTVGRATLGDEGREERSALRQFNNWVKAVLIATRGASLLPGGAVEPQAEWSGPRSGLHVVDLCCGRGGDLKKWRELRPELYVGIDSAIQVVGAAAAKYCDLRGLSTKDTSDKDGSRAGSPARFIVADAFSEQGLSEVSRELAAAASPGAHCVSCQFSFHYAFASEEAARVALRCVARMLRPGGVFLGTVPSDAQIAERRQRAGGGDFGNSVYRVQFSAGAPGGSGCGFGTAYRFYLEQVVRGAEEFVVPWQATVAIAAAEGLELVEEWNFGEFVEQHSAGGPGAALWHKVVRAAAEGAAAPAPPDAAASRGLSPAARGESPTMDSPAHGVSPARAGESPERAESPEMEIDDGEEPAPTPPPRAPPPAAAGAAAAPPGASPPPAAAAAPAAATERPSLLALTPEQREAATLYRAFVFRKRTDAQPADAAGILEREQQAVRAAAAAATRERQAAAEQFRLAREARKRQQQQQQQPPGPAPAGGGEPASPGGAPPAVQPPPKRRRPGSGAPEGPLAASFFSSYNQAR